MTFELFSGCCRVDSRGGDIGIVKAASQSTVALSDIDTITFIISQEYRRYFYILNETFDVSNRMGM